MNRLFKTKFGWCGIVFDNDVIREIVLPSPDKKKILQRLRKRGNKINSATFRQGTPATGLVKGLKRYFNGEKVDFRNRIDLRDYSDFEQAVYKTLVAIPYGRVRTYQWVAQRIGNSGASRAVGNALAKNPLPIIIPCHRIIKSDGSPGNFSAIGGTNLKKKLLELENAVPKGFGMSKENY